MEEKITENIGKYKIIEARGRGSMGVVYKARDPEIGRLVAIKTLKTVYVGEDSEDNEALKRFRQESRSAGRLVHPNIVTIYEAARSEDGSPYIVMEYIEGTSVEVVLAQKGSLDPFTTVHYLAQVASALDYAHQNDIIHRDIKPSNIIVDENQKPFIVDFGVAKMSDTSLTPAGTVVGTPSYMSPEQIRGTELDGRTDIFSLGVVAFEMVTGIRPFPGKDFTTVVSNIIHKEPIPFAQLGVDLDPGFEEVIHRCLAKDREKRFQTAIEFADALAETLGAKVDGSGLIGGIPEQPEVEEDRTLLSTMGEGFDLKGAAVSPSKIAKTQILDDESSSSNASAASDFNDSGTWIYRFGVGFGLACLLIGFWFGYQTLIYEDSPQIVSRIKEKLPAIKEKISGKNQKVKSAKAINQENSSSKSSQMSSASSSAISPGVISSSSSLNVKIPKGGFSKEQVEALSELELNAVLSKEKVDLKTMRRALASASQRKSQVYLPALIKRLEDPRFLVRVDAIKCLKSPPYIKNPAVLDALSGRLGDEDSLVRGFAVKALAQTRSSRAQDALRAALESEKNEVVLRVIKQELEKF
jgi:serine/threonine protein kinase